MVGIWRPPSATPRLPPTAVPTSQSPYPRGRCECKPAKIERYADTDSDGQADDLVAVTDYLFDDAGRLTGLTHHDGATPTPTNIADYDLGYDPAGRIVDFDFTYDGTDYDTNGITYDDTNQLTDVDYDTWQTDEDYDYDDNGNRTNNGFSVGSNNQLTSDGTCTYTYDDEGNRATRTRISQDPADDYLTEYTWDHRNRLTMVTFKNNSGTATKQFEYTYDFGARWIRKTRDTDADGTVDESTVFVYDGNQIALQFDDTSSAALTSDDLSHRYTWNTTTDHLLADEQVTALNQPGSLYWILGDHLGSVRDVIDDNRASKVHRVYDAFGRINDSLSTATIECLFGFTGRPYDADAMANWNLNRWYDMYIGRWLSEDPSGFEAEDANLYRYVANMPVSLSDPLGLWKVARNGGRRAIALSEDGDTIRDLAGLIGFRAEDHGRWITWSGERVIKNRGRISVKSIGRDDKWCPDQVVMVPNTMLAAWFFDNGYKGATGWSDDVTSLRMLGFNVMVHDNDHYHKSQKTASRNAFLDGIRTGVKNKWLHGLFVVAHGSKADRLFGSAYADEKVLGPHGVKMNYSDVHAAIVGRYTLAALIFEVCYSDAPDARGLGSRLWNGGIFFGSKGLVYPTRQPLAASHWGKTNPMWRYDHGWPAEQIRYGGRQATRPFFLNAD